jgi:PAS domain S-box-containing protein
MNGGAKTGGWLRNLPITLKLATILLVFVGIIAILLAVAALSLSLSNGARAYVGGEGLWSKAQKDAVYFLTRYAASHDPADYRRYQSAIAVTRGDRAARLEMEKPDYDAAIVERGFVQGGNAAEDVPDMIFLVRHFGSVRYLADALRIWAEADTHIAALDRSATELHQAIVQGQLTPERQQLLLQRIDRINAVLTPLEHDFSASLGRGARWMRDVLLTSIFVCTALLLALGLWIAGVIARRMNEDIQALRQGALRMSQGDLSQRIPVRSADELGQLAEVFNETMSRRRDIEDALRHAQEFNAKVMEAATSAMFAVDLDGCFTLVNRQTCALTGYDTGELLGSSYRMLIPAADLPDVDAQFATVAQGLQQVTRHETRLIRKDGSVITIVFSNSPLIKDDQAIGVVGSAEDITERKRAAGELLARAEELARSNEELEHFAYVASHDLQEPLRTVASFTQLLARRFDDSEQDAREFVGHITGEVQRMRSLIEGLLAYSRVARAEHPATIVNMNRLLDDALSALRIAIADSGATITRDPLPNLVADAQQVTQLLQNLLANAIKFRGQEPPRIHVGVERDGEHWLFSVRDNGIGIDPQYAERIFVLFQRLHGREVYPGSGLGLAICRKIVERHGGRIWVEPGHPGSLFRFTLPAE